MNQLLLVGVFIILLQTSSAQNKFYSIEGGLSKVITFYCSTRYPAIWTYTNDQAMTYPLSYLNGVHNNSDVLNIFGITSQHEGVYRCYDNQNNIDFLNLTVLAVPKFIGCSAAQSCNLGQTLEIAEGQTLSINLTMEFVNGGNRGVRQRIQFLRFINSSTNIISCGNTCTNFTTRVIPYRDPSDLWILYANITDTQVSDSNVYYVEAALEDGINSNSISVITSTLTIQVTSTTAVIVTSSTIPLSSSMLLVTPTSTTTTISSSSISSSSSSSSSIAAISTNTAVSTSNIEFTSSTLPSSSAVSSTPSSISAIISATSSNSSVVSSTSPITAADVNLGLAVGLPAFAFMMIIVAVIFLIIVLSLIYSWKYRTKKVDMKGPPPEYSRFLSTCSSTSNSSNSPTSPVIVEDPNKPVYATIPVQLSPNVAQNEEAPSPSVVYPSAPPQYTTTLVSKQTTSIYYNNVPIYDFSNTNTIKLTTEINSKTTVV